MRTRALEFLVCPSCRGEFSLETAASEERDHIMQGTLVAACCRRSFPVVGGVPRFVGAGDLGPTEAKTAANFGWEWKAFDRRDPRYAEQFLGWLAPVVPDFFRGKVVLEGGCGKGRHTLLVSDWGARDVVSVDLSEAVDVAFAATRDRMNVHIIQADILELPLRRSFDYAFSVGVLHHIPDPRAAFLALSSKVKSGGHVSAWVYGAENNRWITSVIDPIRKRWTSRMDMRTLYQLAKVPAAALYAATRGVYGPLSRSSVGRDVAAHLFYAPYLTHLASFDFREHHHIVFDHLVAPEAYYIARDAFAGWWRDLLATDVVIAPHNDNSWRGFGRIPSG